MGFPDAHPEVASARAGIMKSGVVPEILKRQKTGGYWDVEEDFYVRAKYRGTVWQVIILADLGADGGDLRVRKACEFILDVSQDRLSGGFSYRGNRKSGGFHGGVLPCLTGNLAWSLLRFGYLNDPRLVQAIGWITDHLRFDDGDAGPPSKWPYEKRDYCWGKHTCLMGIVKSLRALAEIPEASRPPEVERTIGRAAEFLLRHHLYKRSHDRSRPAKPKWLKFGFPTLWDSDALEVLLLRSRLGFRDPRMEDAVDLVLKKQDSQGRWRLENTFNGRFQVNIEKKGKPSKWVTLNALRALKPYFDR